MQSLEPFFPLHISSEQKSNTGKVECPVPMDAEDNLSNYCTLSNYNSWSQDLKELPLLREGDQIPYYT